VPIAWRPLRVSLTWKKAEQLPWAVLILFGGGLSLAAAIQETGLAAWIGNELGGMAGWPLFAVVVVVTAVVIFLTELTSNTATAAAFLPVVASLAVGIGADPMLLAIPAALAASCAFMLPVATPADGEGRPLAESVFHGSSSTGGFRRGRADLQDVSPGLDRQGFRARTSTTAR
jgi:sodium-dependent dicarboxylate transporter 2/3/5